MFYQHQAGSHSFAPLNMRGVPTVIYYPGIKSIERQNIMSMEKVLNYLHSNEAKHLDQLCDFLRIKSISALPENLKDIDLAVDFLVDELKTLNLKVERIETKGNPLVYAETTIDPTKKTLLFYGHYDVQPVDPLELWDSPPFEPTIKDGIIYARGGSDDKGQLYSHIKALEAFINTDTELPVNIKMIFEGEEECGGEAIYIFTEENPEKLACDAVIISDTSLYNEETPAICYSLKGLCFMEINVKGPQMDLHSGSFGGVVQNPGNVIGEIVASLKNKDGVVQIPGFYDDVLDLDDAERESFKSLNYSDDVLRKDTGASGPFGEKGYTTLERMWARPTCDVNGLWSGYTGEGAKTIIPATAGAKISMRLVPNQDPDKIAQSFKDFVMENKPQGVEVKVENLHNANPVLVPRDSEMMKAGFQAIEKGFGNKAVFIREGGSIPIVGTFQSALKSPVLLLGYGLPNDNIHSPNEKYHLVNYYNGIKSTAYLLFEVAKM
jgi:acetylornithine deacetylase/succinyl-diaminopimelate desuccinylase-like protein